MRKEIIKLNKIIGQIKGLTKLIESGKDCEKIIIQFQAVKGALDGVYNDILDQNLEKCIRKHKSKDLKTIIKQISKRK